MEICSQSLLQLSLTAVNPALDTPSFVLHSFAGTEFFSHHKLTVKTVVCLCGQQRLPKEHSIFHTALAHFLSISGSFRLERKVLKNNTVLGSFQVNSQHSLKPPLGKSCSIHLCVMINSQQVLHVQKNHPTLFVSYTCAQLSGLLVSYFFIFMTFLCLLQLEVNCYR